MNMKLNFKILERPKGEEHYFAICNDPLVFLYEKDMRSLAKAAKHARELYASILNEDNKK